LRLCRGRRELLGEERFHLSFQIEPGFGESQVPAAIHQPRGGDAEYSVAQPKLIVPAFGVEVLRPRQLLLLNKPAQRRFLGVQTDADDFKAVRVKLVVSALER
jgi:hypothetical protein